ncbi:hypothetical protein FRB95_001917 [Tulasnella sp. JGI-2019a]|nr:hypothetical protein FRB95_001917 [Tulasnella sp. JGI-2019a]
MSGEIFCCSSATPYRSIRTDHDPKFTAFLTATTQSSIDALQDNATASDVQLSDKAFAVQVVRQINFGPVEWKRYFAPNQGQGDVGGFQEVTEKALVDANFSKLNSYVSPIYIYVPFKHVRIIRAGTVGCISQVQELQMHRAQSILRAEPVQERSGEQASLEGRCCSTSRRDRYLKD